MTRRNHPRNHFPRGTTVWLALTIACSGCNRPCGTTPEPRIWLGTGESTWEEIPDDGRLEVIHGPQGGYHVLISIRGSGLSADGVLIAEMTGDINGVEVARVSPWLQMDCTEDATAREALGLFLIYEAQPADLHRQASRVRVSIEDLDGRRVSTQADILLWDPSIEAEESR